MKVTKATLKSFIRKSEGKLLIRNLSHFDGMTDGIESARDQNFHKVEYVKNKQDYNFGIKGVYMVGSSRDYIQTIEGDDFEGFHIYNCCGSFDLVIKKEKK